MTTNLLAIKGSRDGLRLVLDAAAPWDSVVHGLEAQLERGAMFFHGARVTVELGERDIGDDELSQILGVLRRHRIEAAGLASRSRASRDTARSAGVTLRPTPRASTIDRDDRSDALLVRRTIRSGQVVRHHGNLTIVGDINAGSEVVASGSIIVWGRVRGVIHAGALGDPGCFIGALSLNPPRLGIGDVLSVARGDRARNHPEVAQVIDGAIVFGSWETTRLR